MKPLTFMLVLIISVLVFSAGCRRQVSTGPDAVEYHSGTEGLEMEFVRNLPPDEIAEGSEFVIGLELRNQGAYDIESGRILVYGFEIGYNSLEQQKKEFDIEGKKPGFPKGGYEIINFNAQNHAIPEIVDVYEVPFIVRAFYRYQTEAGAEVCINPHIYSYMETAEAACRPEEVKLSGGQGAPVAVTKIEQTFAPEGKDIKVNFIIYIKNEGDGEVVDGAYIDDVKLADESLECNKEFIELEDQEKRFVCSTTTSISQGAYLAPILVRLSYDYTEKIDKSISIRSME